MVDDPLTSKTMAPVRNDTVPLSASSQDVPRLPTLDNGE